MACHDQATQKLEEVLEVSAPARDTLAPFLRQHLFNGGDVMHHNILLLHRWVGQPAAEDCMLHK